METAFQIVGLPAEKFAPLFNATEEELRGHGARILVADAKPGYPCRVSLTDAEKGERVLTLPFTHHDVDSPYRASGPIFIREGISATEPGVNEVPEMLRIRQLSIRAYDAEAMMVTAKLCSGEQLAELLRDLFSNNRVAYIHLHNAGPGCFNCAVHHA